MCDDSDICDAEKNDSNDIGNSSCVLPIIMSGSPRSHNTAVEPTVDTSADIPCTAVSAPEPRFTQTHARSWSFSGFIAPLCDDPNTCTVTESC